MGLSTNSKDAEFNHASFNIESNAVSAVIKIEWKITTIFELVFDSCKPAYYLTCTDLKKEEKEKEKEVSVEAPANSSLCMCQKSFLSLSSILQPVAKSFLSLSSILEHVSKVLELAAKFR
jgi:hypothetical protein